LDAGSYGRVFSNARRSKDHFFTVLCRENGGRPARLGLAIARKHCKRAVQRNRIKRIVRESFRHQKAQLEGYDFVVLNQAATHRADNRQLFDSLAQHWLQCIAKGQRRQAPRDTT
jgi:ribonuclease P protein component